MLDFFNNRNVRRILERILAEDKTISASDRKRIRTVLDNRELVSYVGGYLRVCYVAARARVSSRLGDLFIWAWQNREDLLAFILDLIETFKRDAVK